MNKIYEYIFNVYKIYAPCYLCLFVKVNVMFLLMSYASGWNRAGSFCCFTEEAQTRPIKNRVRAIKNTECLLLPIGVTSWGCLSIYGIFLYREAWWLHG